MGLTTGATPRGRASSKVVAKGDHMNVSRHAGKESGYPLAEQEARRELEEEARKIRRLQLMISMSRVGGEDLQAGPHQYCERVKTWGMRDGRRPAVND